MLRELRKYALSLDMSSEDLAVVRATRSEIGAALDALNAVLPPEPFWIKHFQWLGLMAAMAAFLLSGSRRIALAYIEWRDAVAQPSQGNT
ncbi:hypothetical protein CYJ10_24195 [Cupriavidus pauculus]|uniref:Uncharacterized protein n=2 Tax=Cupriavidus pauculus TaxID=82633 RepID=A0A2N5C6U7_9BURK|nr:hypothetical protein CYJ10_24195 [Cupriavidus pauculus]